MTPILRQYIEVSTEFRKTQSKESVEKLYDMLYDLQKREKTAEEQRILSDIYTLLGFHLSAYETFKVIADTKNHKDVAKLYTLESKAQSHKDTFILKDLRQFQKKKPQNQFTISDFKQDADDTTDFHLLQDEIIIFNKVLDRTDFRISIHQDYDFKEHFERVSVYLSYLADAKSELLTYYNEKIAPLTETQADDDWYDSLDVYSALVGIDAHGQLFAHISVGDQIDLDHILDFDFENTNIISCSMDG